MAEQNVTKFGMKHHWGKGNPFCINEVDGVIKGRRLCYFFCTLNCMNTKTNRPKENHSWNMGIPIVFGFVLVSLSESTPRQCF